MIIGGSKKEVIENIKINVENKEYNKKAEVNDPCISEDKLKESLTNFYKIRKSKSFQTKSNIANLMLKKVSKEIYPLITLHNFDKLQNVDLSHGAIITCNHFNPLDSLCVRYLIEEKLHKKLYIVILDTNIAMQGVNGFLMNYLDTIPISKNPHYLIKVFMPYLKKVLDEGNLVLIYPEEEMWFNYRKPRPCKRGAYQFARELNTFIIPLFVGINDLETKDNEEFRNVSYDVYILDIINIDDKLTTRKDSKKMAKLDYEQKVKAYEKHYHKKLNYDFTYNDIAGYQNK